MLLAICITHCNKINPRIGDISIPTKGGTIPLNILK
jgi:hypothetical protein